jgi:hypothetical protein
MNEQLIFPPLNLQMGPLDMDSVPSTFEEAVRASASALSQEAQLKATQLTKHEWTAQMHFGGGMQIRNTFSLWERDTPIDLDFWDRWEIWHGDDKSGMLLSAAYDWLRNTPYDPVEDVTRYRAHWQNAGQSPIPPPSRVA